MPASNSNGVPMNKILQAVEDGIQERHDKPDTFRTSTGVVFRIKPVPPLLIVDAQKRFDAPVPPKVLNPDKETMEENPNDPEYARQLQEYHQGLGEVANAVLITRGTEVLEVPPTVETVEDGSWSDDVEEFAGIKVPPAGRRRYFCWVKYVAMANMEDLTGLVGKISNFSGATLEVDVAAAADTFRPVPSGSAAPGVPASEKAGRGPSDRPAADGGDGSKDSA